MKKIVKKEYHPAIEAAVNYWCGVLTGAAEAPEKLAVFRQALSKELAVLLDLHEGFINPSILLIKAMKKARLPLALLPQKTRMTISSSVVTVSDGGGANPRMIWKAPSPVPAPPRKVTDTGP